MLTISPEKDKILTMEKETSTKSPNTALKQILSEVVIKRLEETGIKDQLIIALMNEHTDAVELLKVAFAKPD